MLLTGGLGVLGIAAISSDGALRPNFSLDQCSWNATHIVLVQTTTKGGLFSVVESWKGDLKRGDSLEVRELKPDADAVSISSYPKPSEQIPRQPVDSRMVLFLRRGEQDGATSWEPASSSGEMKVSALWIQRGKAFCFRQGMDSGPSALSECWQFPVMSPDIGVFTARILQILQVQRHLAETLALKDADVRADRLGQIALGDVWEAQKEAIDALGKSGAVALPEILQVMDKPPVPYDGTVLIQALVKAAGKNSGAQLNARLREDLIYWKSLGPTLSSKWIDQLVEPGASLYVKFNETRLLVRELDNEGYSPAAETAAELRDFWVSQPYLYDATWRTDSEVRSGGTALEMIRAESAELARECEAFIRHAAAGKQRR